MQGRESKRKYVAKRKIKETHCYGEEFTMEINKLYTK